MHTYVNFGKSTTAAGGRSIGGASLPVAAGAGSLFGTPSVDAPMRLTIYRPVQDSDPTPVTILLATGRSGDVLTISGPADSVADAAILAGDIVVNGWTAGDVADIYSAIDAKADDSTVAHLAGDQTLTGSVTFSSPIVGSVTGSAASITGVNPVANGGTGLSTLGTAGQVLTVNTAGTALEYQTPSGGGSGGVSSVGLSMPSGFTVSNSPVTTSGVLAVTTTLSGVLKGTGSGFAAAVAGTDFVIPSGNITGTAAGLSSTLATTSGGTGLTAVGSANQVLGTNAAGDGLEYKTITAGANVTVTHGANSITIAASGGGGGGLTSVGLSMPTGFSVANSPLTVDGTLAVSTTLSGMLKGDGSGFVVATAGTDYVTPAGLTTAISGKADDSTVAHLAGDQTLTGSVTFTSPIVGSVSGTAAGLSATLAVASGGTGLASLGTANQVLAVNAAGTALEYQNAASGGLTSVGLTMPTGFSVTGSPLVANGSLGVTTSLSGMLKGTGSGFAAATAGTDFVIPSGNITGTASNVTGTVAVGHGGTGLTSLGTANQVLAVNAAGTALEFQTPSGGGGTFDPSADETITGRWTLKTPIAKGDGTNPVLALQNSSGSSIGGFDKDGYGFIEKISFLLAQGQDLATTTDLSGVFAYANYAGKIDKVKVRAAVNGSSGGFTFDIKKNGTSIFSSARSVAANTTTVQTMTGISTTAVAEDDLFTPVVSAAGAGVQWVLVVISVLVKNG